MRNLVIQAPSNRLEWNVIENSKKEKDENKTALMTKEECAEGDEMKENEKWSDTYIR